MIKLDPMDGEAKVYLYHRTDMLGLLLDSEAAATHMGYHHDLRCFCNYLIAHYKTTGSSKKLYVNFPLEPFD